MPIYDYRCPSCGTTVEVLVRMGEAEPPTCPSCEGEKLEKMPSAGYVARFHASPSNAHNCHGGRGGCDSPGSGCAAPGSCCS